MLKKGRLLTISALNITLGCLDDLTELSVKCSLTAFFSVVKSVGRVIVLTPTYLMQLKAWGTLPTSANRSFRMSLAVFSVPICKTFICFSC